LRDNESPMTFKTNNIKQTGKFFLAVIFCLLFRLLPFRAPNIEPILATIMPLGRAYGALTGFAFSILSVLLYDLLTGTMGVHTFFTAGAFGLLGFWAGSYFKNRKGTVADYVRFAVVGTLFFDAATGLFLGPIFYGQSFSAAFFGQIPFTALHLSGNIIFAITLSPIFYRFFVRQRESEISISIIRPLEPKII